jgi:hypothetical protein
MSQIFSVLTLLDSGDRITFSSLELFYLNLSKPDVVNSRYLLQADRRHHWKRCCFPNWKGEGMFQVVLGVALSIYWESAIILPFSKASANAHPLPFSFPIPSQSG